MTRKNGRVTGYEHLSDAERTTLLRRFHSKVRIDRVTGCHNWIAARVPTGHGLFWDGSRMVGAHRFICALVHGPMLAETDACHQCDNPSCVNPGHLLPDTRQQNMRDAHGIRYWRNRMKKSGVRDVRQLTSHLDDAWADRINADAARKPAYLRGRSA